MLAGLSAAPVAAQLEGVLSPGPVIEGHARIEDDCGRCHVRFDRAAQDRKCLDCHAPVGADRAARRGFHGRVAPQPCRTCHTDHKGRGADILGLDPARFDHRLTDFALRGAHARSTLGCGACHRPGRPHRDAPTTCAGCHRDDDVHRGRLGEDCERCHAESDWKTTRFDHARTGFPLRNRHQPVPCEACHRDGHAGTPVACVACHRAADVHQGRYGERCETCHDDEGWKPAHFDHGRQTGFALRGRHQPLRCAACHVGGQLYRQRLRAECEACHLKDDRHRGTLGTRCGDCHHERGWSATRTDHERTRFPLRGRHAQAACASCHRSAVFREAPRDCLGCHQTDDVHRGRLGSACESCHSESDWRPTRFDHARTRFPLRGGHATARCAACHQDPDYRRTPQECSACHRDDDRHQGQLGPDCGACHDETNWKAVGRFDHGLTRFPLLGAHAPLRCAACHASARFRDARVECVACHAAADVHRRTLGTECGQCHHAGAWKAWDFDHHRRTGFALDGGHRGLACGACHRRAFEGRLKADPACASCHGKDDVHDGRFGRRCETCHATASWRAVRPGGRAAAGGAP